MGKSKKTKKKVNKKVTKKNINKNNKVTKKKDLPKVKEETKISFKEKVSSLFKRKNKPKKKNNKKIKKNKNKLFKKISNLLKKIKPKKNVKVSSKKKKANIKSKKENKYFKKISNLFKKKKSIKKEKTTFKNQINVKGKLGNAYNSLNKKVDLRKDSKFTKEMYVFLFLIINLVIFNFALLVSKLITYEYYNSVEFLALVFLNPLVLIAEGIIYGIKFGFSYVVAVLLTCAFILSVVLFLKIEFTFYLPIYFIFVISSEICGLSLSKVRRI